MRPDLSAVAPLALLVAVLVLVLPKRDWASLSARFRETSCGERRYLFGPPARTGRLSDERGRRLLQLLHAELPRAFELGVPVLLFAWYAEARGAVARREHAAAWRESKSGLLMRHLVGEMTEEDLHARLRERAHLPPAGRLILTEPPKVVMPPMRWRREWEARLKEMEAKRAGLGEAAALTETAGRTPPVAMVTKMTPTDAEASASGPRAGSIEIRTLGEIRVVVDGTDIAPRLMHAPALAFTVFYLLSRALRRPGDRVTRESFGEEMFNRQDPSMRRTGVSQRLANLKRHFPDLRRLIVAEGEYLAFDTSSCDIDVRRVFAVARQVKAAAGSLASELHDDARGALALAAGEYLPGWETIESKGTLGGSAAADVVADVRDEVAGARLDILVGLADGALALQQLDAAAIHLEQALRLRPERTALARRLADVYERSGHQQRANQLRSEYALDDAL